MPALIVRPRATALLTLCALACLASSPTLAQARGEAVGRYTVRKGDTLDALARAWFPAPGALKRVQRLNRIANPRRMPTGQRLVVPRSLLADEPGTATVESLTGPVMIEIAGRQGAARAGAILREGAVIRTGPSGFVSLRLADQSAITLPSQSTVRIARLRRVLMTGAVERTFTAESGRVRVLVTPMTERGSNFEVRTPLTVAAVRGTSFRVNFDPAASVATTEVEEGKVGFASAADDAGRRLPASDVLVTAGFGARKSPDGESGPVPLLAAPRLAEPDRVQTEEGLYFAAEPLAGAATYRLQVARDAGMLDLVAEATSADGTFALPGLPAGTWFTRISAIDPAGMEGLARTYSFDRIRNSVAGAMDTAGTGFERRYQFKWSGTADGTPQYRFELTRKGQPAHPLVDEPLGATTAIAVTSLLPGEYSWRVLSLVPRADRVIAVWSAEQSFEVSGRK